MADPTTHHPIITGGSHILLYVRSAPPIDSNSSFHCLRSPLRRPNRLVTIPWKSTIVSKPAMFLVTTQKKTQCVHIAPYTEKSRLPVPYRASTSVVRKSFENLGCNQSRLVSQCTKVWLCSWDPAHSLTPATLSQCNVIYALSISVHVVNKWQCGLANHAQEDNHSLNYRSLRVGPCVGQSIRAANFLVYTALRSLYDKFCLVRVSTRGATLQSQLHSIFADSSVNLQ